MPEGFLLPLFGRVAPFSELNLKIILALLRRKRSDDVVFLLSEINKFKWISA
jgi:hypothetical protein